MGIKYLHTMVRVSDIDASLRFYCEGLGLKDGEPQQIKALLRLPAVLRPIEPNEKYAVGNLGVRIPCSVRESRNMTFHPATSWLGGA